MNFDEPSKGQVSSTETALSVVNTGAGEGIRGTTSSNTASAVTAMSNGSGPAAALTAISNGGAPGGWFQSKTGEGIRGTTYSDDANLHAVVGISEGRARGGWFQSKTGEGIRGTTYSDDHAAVVGVSNGGALAGFFSGNVEVTGDIRLLGADCAEDFDVSTNGGQTIEPGTVVVLNAGGNLEPSCQAYDKKVAGVISGAGGYKPGIVLDRYRQEEEEQESEDDADRRRMPVALVGKVYCKVDATPSPIEVGDLLTTSPTEGHAMKASDPIKAFGTVIGKALKSLKEGRGLIPILIALQ
jgi:hypothetical protein